jgi:hypothetical protein
MIQFFKILLLLNLINLITIYGVYSNYKLRNIALRFIAFKEKKLGKVFKSLKNLSKIYYDKLIVCTAEGINNYNELSDEDKTIIETIISLYY